MEKTLSLEDCIANLKKLDSEIRKLQRAEGQSRMAPFNETIRDLTSGEWEMVREAIKQHELPCRLLPSVYGFALCVHAHMEAPGIQPELLLMIEDGQFPFPSADLGFVGQIETLHELSPITHGERNSELLALYGFDPLESPEYYAY